MKRSRLKRTDSLRRTGSPKRKTRIRSVNEQRRAKRRERDFGEKAAWIATLPCLACGRTPSDPHHYPTRGAGGTAKDMTPLCRTHHLQFHALGVKMFEALHRLDLVSEAEHYERAWQARREA